MGLPLMLVALANLICLVLVLIKQFQNAGAVHGIIGIVTCGIWTFIWGWINSPKLNFWALMLVWTTLIVVQFIIMNIGRCYSPWTPFFMC
jgi:hypothetical protein